MRINNIFLASVACIGSLTGCEQQVETSENLIITQAALDALIVEHPMFSGSAIVAQDGEIAASVYTGFANRESGKLNDAQTLHSVSSAGKMFTAVAIIQLVDLGRLAYETPVIDIIPELSDQISNAITVDHLLQHRSGLERMSGLDNATLDALRNNADYFALILSSGIRSAGTSDFSYRNENFQILGEVIERISGQSYETYIRENISDPVDMAGPVFVRRDLAATQPIAEHYLAVDFETRLNSEDPIEAQSADEFIHIAPPATPAAGGGAYATALDMIRFATALRDGTLISLASFEAMCALAPGAPAPAGGYGRGCLISVGEHGTRVGHMGSSAGIQARFFLYSEQDIDVVVLSNHDGQAVPIFARIDSLIRTE